MMERLSVRCLRNLRQVDLLLDTTATVFTGANGAGKTALLEALYLLSRRRSFRGRRFGSLVTRGELCARIEGLLVQGRQRRRIVWESRPEGVADAGVDEVGRRGFRVRLICDASHALVEGDPALRRRFVDWNVFHVEPAHAKRLARFRRIAAQRNAWLRGGGRGKNVWDPAYAQAVAEIGQRRAQFFDELRCAFDDLIGRGGWFAGLVPTWQDPWRDAAAVEERLAGMRDADIARGYSYIGPARADFGFENDGLRWIGSRGESKVVGTLMQLAAEAVVTTTTGDRAMWLVDDLAAELGEEWQSDLLALMWAQCGQLVLTALPGRLPRLPEGMSPAMFHVEHGGVRRLGSGSGSV